MDRSAQDKHQDQLRVLADLLTDIYRMKAVFYRAQYVKSPDSIHQWMTTAICEQGFQRVVTASNELIAALEIEDYVREELFIAVKNIDIPMFHNLFLIKRKIAKYMIANGKYKT